MTKLHVENDALFHDPDCYGPVVAHVLDNECDEDGENVTARRLAACWNACIDVPLDLLEQYHAPFSQLRFERDKLADDYRAQGLALQAAKEMQAGETERADKAEAQLAQHVTEWLCDKCNTVHPAPTSLNHSCKTPNCDGWMRLSSPELRRVEHQRDQLAVTLRKFVPVNRFKEDGKWFKGDPNGVGFQLADFEAQACDALAAIGEKQ